MRVLTLILDALDVNNLHIYEFDRLQDRYRESGQVFTCSTRPHTAESMPMIFGGIRNTSRYWVEPESATVEGLHGHSVSETGFVDPAMFFDREQGEAVDGARGFSRAEDYAGESFVWDDLAAEGYDARALQVPVVLPPFSTETVTDVLDDAWFPDSQTRMGAHVRRKPDLIREQLEDGADYLASTVQMPDKWLHGLASGEITSSWTRQESRLLDEKVEELLTYCEEHGIEWTVMGDHGSPTEGAMRARGGEYHLPRHEKESIIISSEGVDPPTYTDEFYPWLLDLYGVEPVDECVVPGREADGDLDDVDERLRALGYKSD